jgi:hypothetical protein
VHLIFSSSLTSFSSNPSKPTLNHQQSLPSRNSTSTLTDSRTKELEAQLREKEKDLLYLLETRLVSDQIERQKADVDGRCRELEQKIRKIESVTKESSRSQEENLKKIFTYEAENSSLKSKVLFNHLFSLPLSSSLPNKVNSIAVIRKR